MCPKGKTCGGRPNSLSGIGDCVLGSGGDGVEELPSFGCFADSEVVVGAIVDDGDSSVDVAGVEADDPSEGCG